MYVIAKIESEVLKLQVKFPFINNLFENEMYTYI